MSLRGKSIVKSFDGPTNGKTFLVDNASGNATEISAQRAAEMRAEMDRRDKTVQGRRDAGLNDDGTRKS